MDQYGKNQKWVVAPTKNLPYNISKISTRLNDVTAMTAEDYDVFKKI